MTYIQYGIYLGGFNVILEGTEQMVFVSNRFLEDRTQSVSVGDRIFNSLQDAQSAVSAFTPAGDKIPRHAYYWGAGGMTIAPTVFSPATTPRIFETLMNARAELARQVMTGLGQLAIQMVINKVLGFFYGRALKSGTGEEDVPVRKTPQPEPSQGQLVPVNGKVNVGGGFEEGSANATNLNPIISGTGGPTKGIPNHVNARFEEMDNIFKPGSVKELISNRLPSQTVNWDRAAQAAAKVMPSGGKVSLNVWTQSKEEVNTIINAFQNAGFKNVQNATGQVGTATIITGIR
jgi:hypothetical protein